MGLVLLLLTGVGPLLGWRSSTVSAMWHQFKWPIVTGLAAGAITLAVGIRVWTSGLCFVLSGFVIGTIVQEFWRGAAVRRQSTGTDLFTALVGLVSRNKRRYGGYIVHVGIVLMFMGFAGEGFGRDEQALLKPGQQVQIDRYVLRLDAIRATEDDQKQMVTAQITVLDEAGKNLGTMHPAKWFYRSRPDEPTTEVAIRRSLAEDLYIVMAAFELGEQSASVEVHVNELVNWIWIGFGLMALGTGIALLPETVFAFAGVRAGAEVAATLVLIGLLMTPVPARAHDHEQEANATPADASPATTGTIVFRSPLERELANEIMCTCGCRLPAGTCGMMNCHGKEEQLGKIHDLVSQGMDRDAVLATFVRDAGGQHILARPIDEGAHKLIWLAPYTLAALSALGLAWLARRWAAGRTEAPAAGQGPTPADDSLRQQLDDELRDLD
ncbi:MAG: cytochrome c-type biogenesis CcmF C-terminal domain-containing protein [Vicinamibacterales bacterium]